MTDPNWKTPLERACEFLPAGGPGRAMCERAAERMRELRNHIDYVVREAVEEVGISSDGRVYARLRRP